MVHCVYAFMLAFSSVYMAIKTPENEELFLSTLDDNQYGVYKNIRQERLNIYFRSLFLAFCVGLLHYMRNKDVCYMILITLILTSMMYMISPKSKYMIDYIKTKEQFVALDEFNKQQKFNGFSSTALALLIAVMVYTSDK